MGLEPTVTMNAARMAGRPGRGASRTVKARRLGAVAQHAVIALIARPGASAATALRTVKAALPMVMVALVLVLTSAGCAPHMKSDLKLMEEREHRSALIDPLNRRIEQANRSIASGDTAAALDGYQALAERAGGVADSLSRMRARDDAAVTQVQEIAAHARWNILGIGFARDQNRYGGLVRQLNEAATAAQDDPEALGATYASIERETKALIKKVKDAEGRADLEGASDLQQEYGLLARQASKIGREARRRAAAAGYDALVARYNRILLEEKENVSRAEADPKGAVTGYRHVEQDAANLARSLASLADSLARWPLAEHGGPLSASIDSLAKRTESLRLAARFNWIAAEESELTALFNQYHYAYDRNYDFGVAKLREIQDRAKNLMDLPELDAELQSDLQRLSALIEEALEEALNTHRGDPPVVRSSMGSSGATEDR